MRRFIPSRVLCAVAWVVACLGRQALAQTPVVEPLHWQPQRGAFASSSNLPTAAPTGPLAILVRNPGLEPGLPPYALADQTGAIQRYVEPVPGTELETHVGQTVRVKHDTGRTLLSTQLEFTGGTGAVVPVALNASTGLQPRAVRTADFATEAGAPSIPSSTVTIVPEGIVAEEISTPVPNGGEPIWRDEMEMPTGTTHGGCNCPRCQAARGQSFARPCCPDNCDQYGGRSNRSRCFLDGCGWDCCICDALVGERRNQCTASSCGPDGCYGESYGTGCGSECGCGLCGGDRWTRVHPGIIGGVELLFLRGYDSEPDSVSSRSYETGSRFELGYMNDCGRAWRLRYFQFDHPNFDGDNFLDLEYLDLEYAGRFTLGCNWRGELSGGLRWSKVHDENDNLYETPLGPVLGAQLRGPCCIGLEMYGLVRQSFQYGQEENDGFYGTFGITETQIGLEYQTCACGGTGFGRAFIEGQSWQGIEDEDTEDVGLFGFGLAIGLMR